MIEKDLSTLLNADSIIIDGASKAGKITFFLYLVNFLYQKTSVIFTPQEKYLFNRRTEALSSQFPQFKNLKEFISPYFLHENWTSLKQKYGYDFFLKELIKIITTSDEKIIVIHRLGEYFEFQDRYEIENIYKTLIKVVREHDKKIIFLVNNTNENYEYIHRIAEEFTDISISLKNNDNNERILDVRDTLHNQQHPLMHFRINEENFILDYYKKDEVQYHNKMKNILIAEIDLAHDNMTDIFTYIFNRKDFILKYANSLQSILQEVFISPEIIIVLMKRKDENFKTISAIKKQLPDTKIIAILDQDFVRSEDIQEAYNNGCDELFANNLSFENILLALQKATKDLFYTQSLNKVTKYDNILNSLDELKHLANECIEKSIFFTIFVIESKEEFNEVTNPSRNNDYIYQDKHRISYLAINTMPKDVNKIINNYKRKYEDTTLTCLWEPVNHTSLNECTLI